MKILHVITSLKIGGAESALANFLSATINDGNIHYVVYFYSGPNREKIENLGIKTFQIDGLFSKYDIFAYLKLKKIIKKISPDLIHSSLWLANFYSKFIASSLKIPIICDLHSNFLHDGRIRIFLEKLNLLKADKYVAVSNNVKNGFLKCFESQAEKLNEKITVIENGIDINLIKSKSQNIDKSFLGFNSSDFVFGAVGRLETVKSYDVLIRAFASLKKDIKNTKLCFVGSGSQEFFLKELVNSLGLSKKIIFMGNQTNPYGFYKIFDCFVISSKSEGLSIALLEAMAFGLPIISTKYSDRHDLLENNINGLLVEPGNLLALKDAMQKIYEDKGLRVLMGKNNIELIEKRYSIEHVVNSYNKSYCNLFFSSL
ncbi:glycosyltransferase [Candidatus Dependentiae bacterium]|nr:glycosyltransferase [Candidatus Dependentiae bacterium]MBU4387761.1 glycosyltransferase [Candidatus Dependentiae bacterium]MCG2755878.1 glycosyltransferase [Candidatus Dependentiae bacterium]